MLQDQVGTRLPHDYYDLAHLYGAGTFVDPRRLKLIVYNPFSPHYLDHIRDHRFLLEGLKNGEGEKSVPFAIFPVSPGLLPWGSDDNSNELYWLTLGEPEHWPIVLRSHDNRWEEYPGPMTTFLAQLFRREINSESWPAPFFSNWPDMYFEPEQLSPSGPAPKNIYELYVENGNRAGFWVRQIDSQPGVSLLIKTVDGRSEGALLGVPNEYGRPAVNADLFLDDQLVENSSDMSHAYQPRFLLVQPPRSSPA